MYACLHMHIFEMSKLLIYINKNYFLKYIICAFRWSRHNRKSYVRCSFVRLCPTLIYYPQRPLQFHVIQKVNVNLCWSEKFFLCAPNNTLHSATHTNYIQTGKHGGSKYFRYGISILWRLVSVLRCGEVWKGAHSQSDRNVSVCKSVQRRHTTGK